MKRARGHLGHVIRMLEEGSDCEAVLTQLAAVNRAIARSGYSVVTGLRQCLAAGDDGPGSGDVKKTEKLFLAPA